MSDAVIFVSSFVLGIGSSLHCVGMCGPLVAAVPFPTGMKSSFTRLLYFSGKALAYGSLGILIGLLGFKQIWGQYQQYLTIAAGILILLMVLFPLIKPKGVIKPLQNQFNKVYTLLRERPKWWHFLNLGFLNGLLPCGMVYVALTAALAAGGPVQGFVSMLFFGIGTMPALWILSWAKGKVSQNFRRKLKPLSLVLSVAVGLLLILRGLDLGIPYISPKMDKGHAACCSGSKTHSGKESMNMEH